MRNRMMRILYLIFASPKGHLKIAQPKAQHKCRAMVIQIGNEKNLSYI